MGTRRIKKGVSAALALVLTVGLMPAMPTIALADENAAVVATERSTEVQEAVTPSAASAREVTFAGEGTAANPYQVGNAEDLAKVINYPTVNAEIHVKMTTSVSGVGLLNVSNGKKVTVDLNGCTIEFAPNSGNARNYFQVNGGSLSLVGKGTVKEQGDGQLGGGAYYAPVMVFGSDADVPAYSVVKVDKDIILQGWSGIFVSVKSGVDGKNHALGVEITCAGTIKSVLDSTGSGGHGVYINGSNQDISDNAPKITLTETSSVTSKGNGIYAAGYAIWNLAGDVQGDDALSIKCGDFTITGGTYHSTGAFADPAEANGNGSENTGAALSITSNDAYAKRTNVVVTGGEFKSDNGYAVYEGIARNGNTPAAYSSYATLQIQGGTFEGNAEKDAVSITKAANKKVISGGTFSSAVSDDYLSDGVKSTGVTTGSNNQTFIISQSADVVEVAGTKYASIAAALQQASSSPIELKLLADVYEDVTISEGKTVVLDLNGFTLTNSATHTITNNGVLTIKDSSAEGTGMVDCWTHGKGALVNSGAATLESGTLTRSKEAGSSASDNGGNSWYVVQNVKDTDSKLTIAGGTIIGTSKYSSLVDNWGTVEMTDGTLSSGFIVLKNEELGTMKVTGGSVTSTEGEQAVQNWNYAELLSGTFNGLITSWSFKSGETDYTSTTTIGGNAVVNGEIRAVDYDANTAGSKVEITGGTITGELKVGSYENGGFRPSDGSSTGVGSSIAVTGGKFNNNPKYFLAKGHVAAVEGETSFRVIDRLNLPVGTYEVAPGDDQLTSADLQSGLTAVVNQDGTVTVSRPYTPPSERYYYIATEQPEHGTLAASTTYSKPGRTITVTVTPDEEYVVKSVSVVDKDGDALEVTANADGTWSFTMPIGGVTVSAAIEAVTYGAQIAQPEGGAISIAPEAAAAGETVVLTVTPEAGKQVDEVSVLDQAGNPVEVTPNSDGTWSFVMPKGGVSVTAALSCDGGELCPSHRFTDVDTALWYHEAIDWAVENSVLRGIDGTTLMMPDGDITRAQMAQILWNVEGNEPAATEVAFTDVGQGEWYVGAISWAVEAGVFKGYEGTGAFGPDDSLTREQAALVLQRWSELNGVDTSARADLSTYPDAEEVSEWATEGVSWAVAAGVIKGVDLEDGSAILDPTGTASRAQTAQLMMRLIDEA